MHRMRACRMVTHAVPRVAKASTSHPIIRRSPSTVAYTVAQAAMVACVCTMVSAPLHPARRHGRSRRRSRHTHHARGIRITHYRDLLHQPHLRLSERSTEPANRVDRTVRVSNWLESRTEAVRGKGAPHGWCIISSVSFQSAGGGNLPPPPPPQLPPTPAMPYVPRGGAAPMEGCGKEGIPPAR